MNLKRLYIELGNHYKDRERCDELYDDYFLPALILEGLTLEQAKIVRDKAWSDGHSNGYSEVIAMAQELTEMALKLIATVSK